MVDFDYFLTQKYRAMNTQADAQANLANTQAQLMPADQAARQAALAKQSDAALIGARASQTTANANASHLTALTPFEMGRMQAQTGLLGAQTNLTGQQASELGDARDFLDTGAKSRLYTALGVPFDNTPRGPATGNQTGGATGRSGRGLVPPGGIPSPTPYSSDPTVDPVTGKKLPGYKKGTANVKGPGDGTVDTIPTMLANGEAVLNKGAAEHMGRDNIKALNHIGMLKMGMGPGQQQQPQAKGKGMPAGKPAEGQKGKPAPTPAKGGGKAAGGPKGKPGVQHFAEGTSNVQPKGVGDFVSAVARTAVNQIFGGQQPSMPSRAPAPAAAPAPTSGYQYRSVLDQASDGSYPMRAYAGGHSNVGKGKKSDTPTNLNPKMLQAVMGMLQGGMPQAQPQQPQGLGPQGMM